MRLIDALELVRDIDIAFKGIKASDEEFERFRDLCGLIWLQPIVDPVKHGRWIDDYNAEESPFFRKGCKCSACGFRTSYGKPKYCMNCGARMETEKENEK